MTITYKYKGDLVVLKPRVDRPAEVDTTFLNEDGMKRNYYKFHVEWAWAKGRHTPAGHGWIFTKGLNWLTGQFRHAPFLWAHAVVYVASIALLAKLAFLLLENMT
jgi:hypothetical protein